MIHVNSKKKLNNNTNVSNNMISSTNINNNWS